MKSILLAFCLFFSSSIALECSSQTVNFTNTLTSYVIKSDPNDLAAKNCKYTFTVPKYFVPTITFMNIQLTGNNKITTRQYSEYGGSQSFEIKETLLMNLAPVDFSIEINLPAKTATDTFSILIQVKDKTPVITGATFVVKEDLGTLIDSYEIQGNSSLIQTFNQQNPQAAKGYTIKIALFSEISTWFSVISNYHVYDDGLYKGSLLDVFNAPNSYKICTGSQFAIVNTASTSPGVFTVLVSGTHDWSEDSVFVTNAPYKNTTQTFTATNGLVVYHEISNPLGGSLTPNLYQQISFRGDGELNVYAGCVTKDQDSRRIATITPSNAPNFENLMIYGRCKTFVLSKGVLQWQVQNTYTTKYRHQIGQKGVIMSASFPYPNMDNVTRNYLIQSPDEQSRENIIVTYEVASMASDVFFHIEEEIKAMQEVNKTLTSTDKSFTSVSTFQQFIHYQVPNFSDGFLIRYTVTSSTRLSFSIGSLFIVFCLYLK